LFGTDTIDDDREVALTTDDRLAIYQLITLHGYLIGRG
jgi:hypothetical protein